MMRTSFIFLASVAIVSVKQLDGTAVQNFASRGDWYTVDASVEEVAPVQLKQALTDGLSTHDIGPVVRLQSGTSMRVIFSSDKVGSALPYSVAIYANYQNQRLEGTSRNNGPPLEGLDKFSIEVALQGSAAVKWETIFEKHFFDTVSVDGKQVPVLLSAFKSLGSVHRAVHAWRVEIRNENMDAAHCQLSEVEINFLEPNDVNYRNLLDALALITSSRYFYGSLAATRDIKWLHPFNNSWHAANAAVDVAFRVQEGALGKENGKLATNLQGLALRREICLALGDASTPAPRHYCTPAAPIDGIAAKNMKYTPGFKMQLQVEKNACSLCFLQHVLCYLMLHHLCLFFKCCSA